MLNGSQRIGEGQLDAPEDVAYDPKTGLIYTGCADGWVSRVKGLLSISKDGIVELLTDEADGTKFKLTDAVDIGPDGMLYFTDASSKYGIHECYPDVLEGKPNGRFLSYNPSTKETKVLVPDLYFANGVAVSEDQTFVIFCETPMRRCKKFYIEGPRKGSVDIFVENLPGFPDNVRYDGEGRYWIALSMGTSYLWDLGHRHPFLRKVTSIMNRYMNTLTLLLKNGGAVAVELDGKPIAHYYDYGASLVSSGIKIGEHLYCGSVAAPYILRLNLQEYPATPAT